MSRYRERKTQKDYRDLILHCRISANEMTLLTEVQELKNNGRIYDKASRVDCIVRGLELLKKHLKEKGEKNE